MSEELVLITGVSGFIGHEVLRQTLEAGYKIRAVIRKESNIENTKKALANPELFSKIKFSVVPDLAAPNAFAKSLSAVTSIIHVASPVGTSKPPLRRQNCPQPPLLAYAASKAMSLDGAQEFIDKEKPNFDIVFLVPSLAIGASQLDTTAEDVSVHGTNKLVMNLLLGKSNDPSLGSSVSLHDVAKLHVLALNKSVPAGRYMVASGGKEGTNWTDVIAIAKKYFPEESEKLFVKEGERHSVKINIDTTETEKAFGLKFQSFEEQVKSVVSSYLSLLKKDAK
ncbi:uncharacterized protein PAC_10542 [Phialocephala subalpina]|uniref:NAD-dependent epimerase/dehydratase domain-containing protein n=1 Tax=Phialocephala subalpina TaxID=576137 RepID=A0A1L7X6J8_9HELO|nr:uncharacterized protein PAC_10542 [Phialocephala subalpina]